MTWFWFETSESKDLKWWHQSTAALPYSLPMCWINGSTPVTFVMRPTQSNCRSTKHATNLPRIIVNHTRTCAHNDTSNCLPVLMWNQLFYKFLTDNDQDCTVLTTYMWILELNLQITRWEVGEIGLWPVQYEMTMLFQDICVHWCVCRLWSRSYFLFFQF